jgi:DNA adenine methylase
MANEPNKIEAGPFLKWAGGKRQLLKQYEPFFPQTPMHNYFEPFLGGGAIFFHLHRRGLFQNYHLSESNPELMNCYRVVRDQVEEVIARLSEHKAQHSQEHYYAVRDQDRDSHWLSTPAVERAARMIYLNKTCYNGLWRVNSEGFFNVPLGRYKNPDILNEDRLRAASQTLQRVALAIADFEIVIWKAKRGDFIYLDPPYDPLSDTANFTSYSPNRPQKYTALDNTADLTKNTFGEYEQRKLGLVFRELNRRGCKVMLSNSDTKLIREIYDGYRIETVTARRAISSEGKKRDAITEVVVINY